MKKLIHTVWPKLLTIKKMTILKKMVIGYFLLVFFPVILFGSIFLYLSYNNIFEDFSRGKQSLVNQAAESLEVSLDQVESIYPLFQNNSPVMDYLNGQYQYEGDQVYHYLKDVSPVFSFANSANKAVRSVHLYKFKNSVMPIQGQIDDFQSFKSKQAKDVLSKLKINEGKWFATKGPSDIPYLSYYHKVYNDQFTDELAILEVKTNGQILQNFIQSINLKNKSEVVIGKGSSILYESPELQKSGLNIRNIMNEMKQGNQPYMYSQEDKKLINSVTLKKLQLSFYFFSPAGEVFTDLQNKFLVLGIAMLSLLFVLSVIYYLTASTLTNRVLHLARHMRNVDQNNLTKLDVKQYDDEFGYLTASYNSMIQRIDELVNKVHVAELMKKEADYLVMQAQIKPHFLYNTLESIRMMAEMNDDQEVVDATYTFGKLLRYSLTPKGNETSLQDEVENLVYFLKIHKIRMMDRLQYNIKVDTNIDNIRCPRFILQPLVENCINHGLSKMRKQGLIDIIITQQEPFLQIRISDNGPGISQERLDMIRGVLNNEIDRSVLQTNDSGLGLFNVSERIKAFFGKESSFEIESVLGEGTVYTLKLMI